MKQNTQIQPNKLARARPRLIVDHDITQRLSAAGLIYLKAFMSQRSAYCARRSAELVHQMRVAIRRLRTVLQVLTLITADDKFASHNHALKKFAHTLGHGRDQDIFIAMLQQIPDSFHHDLDAQERAVHDIIAVRDKCYLQVDAVLQSHEITAGFDQLIHLFQTRDFALQPAFQNSATSDAMVLDQLLRTALKRGRKFSQQDLIQRHRLRISLKKLRYALEFLALDRAQTARARGYQKSIERMMSQLGAANDAFTASRLAKESLDQNNSRIHMMAGMIAGWHGRAVQDNEKALIKTWQSFKSLKPYWN